MKRLLAKYLPEKGQGLVEYALLLVLIAVVVIGILSLLGPMVSDVFADIVAVLSGSDITLVAKDCNDSGKLHVDVQYKGGYDPLVPLTITPPGVKMDKRTGSWSGYHFKDNSKTIVCPATVKITSSEGDIFTVTVP